MERLYDKEEDILSIRIKNGVYWKSVELEDGTVLDISKDGSVLCIEILKASKVFSNAKEVINKAKQTA